MATIMIVDDAIVIREKLKIIFTKAGHEIVAEAGNGIQAAMAYSKYKPEIVTMDITMPEVDGIEGIARIKAIDPGAAILVVSALGQKSMVVEALEAGASGYIIKPFDSKKILSTVETIEAQLRAKRGQSEAQIRAEMESMKKEKKKLDLRFGSMEKDKCPK